MESKICNNCKIEKPKTDFRVLKDGRLYSYCKECKRKQDKEYRDKNKEKVRKSLKKWREENKERKYLMDKEYREKNKDLIKEKKKKYREENKERLRERDKLYYEKNKAKFKKYREENEDKIKREAKKYREENKEYFKKKSRENYEREKELGIDRKKEWIENNREQYREYTREYTKERMENDLQFKMVVNHRKRVSWVFKELKLKKKRSSKDILGTDIDEVIKHIEEQFKDGMNWENYWDWHIDHIIPLSSSSNTEELEALFYYKNIQPMWGDENLTKGTQYDELEKQKYLDWYNTNIKK